MSPKRRARPSIAALASRHGLSTHTASSIQESFSLFSIKHPDYPNEPIGVLKREDVRRCLKALGATPSAQDLPSILESLDPEKEGFVTFEPFLEVAGLYLSEQEGEDDAEDDAMSPSSSDLSDDQEVPARAKGKKRSSSGKLAATSRKKGKGKATVVQTSREEIDTAFKLFTKGGTGPITFQHLRRVARELREDIGDDMLRDMILEANGECVPESNPREAWKKGVAIEDFENVMRRAGVFG